jgi:ferredoxin-type protein NapG
MSNSSDNPDPKASKRFSRRGFFRDGLRELLRPVVDSLDEKLDQLKRSLPPPPRGRDVSLQLLRPPGALEEADFLKTCSRCAACVTACPADAIKINLNVADGAPYIDANLAPCVVCTTLECMMVCPSGALVPTPIRNIDMGTARWDESTCVRSKGQECQICVDECPIGEFAIRLVDGRVSVSESGCVGCGVCQNRCPTRPRSIVVEPRAARTFG